MIRRDRYDAVVVGAGPNGLAAAITLAQAGKRVLLVEGQERIGGGARSFELTLPGFLHDFGSAIHPLGLGSPFFRTLPLEEHGLQWIHPPVPLAHPLDDGTAVVLDRSIEVTAGGLDGVDAKAYRSLMVSLVAAWPQLASTLLGPLSLPRHPLALARFGVHGMASARSLAGSFEGQRARALIAGLGAHSFLKLEQLPSAAFALVLGILGHAVGWPFPQGGAGKIAGALAGVLQSLGGETVTGTPVRDINELPSCTALLCDVTPRQLIGMAATCLPDSYRRKLQRYRYGPGVFKIDYALDGPIPWTAMACTQAGTVHLGGTFEEIAAAERAVAEGRLPERPFVLIAQPSLFDHTRAPQGKHTAWAYCHVPNASAVDMTSRIEAQIERFAPGFGELILARGAMGPAELERHDANLIGGDINGGMQDLRQLYARPVLRLVPYATPSRDLYICSSSTPPGGGVHGMCGYHAARAALQRSFG